MGFKATLCALMLLSAVFIAFDEPRLWIFDEQGRALASMRALQGFSLHFIHSINLSPVDEEFVITGDRRLLLNRVLFDQFGTGMPTGEEDGVSMEGGRYATRPLRIFSEIALRVSPVPGHELRLGDAPLALSRWAKPGGLLILRAAPGYGLRRR
jgi:hypothetical protein